MKRSMVFFLLFCLASLLPIKSAKADWINLTGSENARNIAEISIEKDHVKALPSFNPTTRRIQRLLIGHATEIDVDANGRMLLSNPLREYAQLGKKIVLIGQGKKFELWDEAMWNARMGEWLSDERSEEMPEALAELTL